MKRLDRILQLASHAESIAASEYHAQLDKLNNNINKLDELAGYRDEYINHLEAMSGSGVSHHVITNCKAFIHNLETAIDQQRQLVDQFRQITNKCKQHWLTKRSRCHSLNTLNEKLRSTHHREMAKIEQRILDDANCGTKNRGNS